MTEETEDEHRQRVLATLAENGIEVTHDGPAPEEQILLGDDLASLAEAAGPSALTLFIELADLLTARTKPMHSLSAERHALGRLSAELHLAAAVAAAVA